MGAQPGAVTPGFALGVDLGTSNTVAVLRWPDGRTRPLLFGGAPVMPSGVFADEYGRLVVGQDAQRLAGMDPASFEPNPKRRIDEPTVLLGRREYHTVDLLGALLAAVARAAVEAVGFLPPAVLTYPAAWGPQRRATLAAAAHRAGWPPPRMVPEPVAAARYFADVLRRPVPVGCSLAVFDFGGGTLDIAVVRNDGGGVFSVVGSGGVENLGGLDIDAALVGHLGGIVRSFAPQVWDAVTAPTTTVDRRSRRIFWEDVRGAKEMLSRAVTAPIAVPGRDEALHLTRQELERVAQPLLDRAVAETVDVIRRCGLRSDQLAGLFLVGGSSRLPAVARLLHVGTSIAPTVLEQPELPVAEGALAELPLPVGPVSGGPVSGGPVSGGPVSGGPVSGGPGVAPGGPLPPRRRLTRPVVWIPAVAATLAIALVVLTVVLLRDPSSTVTFAPPLDAGARIAIPERSTYPTAFTTVDGDRAYAVLADGDTVSVGAFDLAKNTKLWDLREVSTRSGRWIGAAAVPEGIVLRGASYADDPGRLVVLDPKTGRQRWDREIGDDDDLVFSHEVLVLGSDKTKTTVGLDWSSGTERWNKPNPKSSIGSESVTTLTTIETADLAGPSWFDQSVASRRVPAGRSLLQFSASGKKLVVRNPDNGEVRKELSGVGDGYGSRYLAYNGKFYVAGSGSAYRIDEFDTTRGGTQNAVYQAPEEHSLKALVPCGERRICALEEADDTRRLVAVDLAKRKKAWDVEVKGAETVVPVGDNVLVGADGDQSWLFDAKGNQVLDEQYRKDTMGVRIGQGEVLLLYGSSFGTSVTELSLTGLYPADGKRIPLGRLQAAAQSCSWSSTHLVCSTGTEFRVWRFAKRS